MSANGHTEKVSERYRQKEYLKETELQEIGQITGPGVAY